jgi:hypothetical protein
MRRMSTCIQKQMPIFIFRQLGKLEFKRLPEHIHSNINVIIVRCTIFCVVAAEHKRKATTLCRPIRLPRRCAVKGDVAVSASHIIQILKVMLIPQDRMVFAKLNALLHKPKLFGIVLQERPIEPVYIMGTPWLINSIAIAFFICRRRNFRISGLCVSPSAPQFQL